MDDDLEARMRDLGRQPVDRGVADEHQRMLVHARSRPARRRFGWPAVVAALVVGFLAGSTALASAGTLPDPAQDVAHDVLGAVGVDVPRSTDGCPAGRTYRNHGDYVSSVDAAGSDVDAAAHSSCGKPAKGTHGKGSAGDEGSGTPRAATDGKPCTGRPPWAGAHLSEAEKQALQVERAATCGDDEVEDEPRAKAETDERDAEATTSTTSTTAPTTTTVAPSSTTVDEPTTTTIG